MANTPDTRAVAELVITPGRVMVSYCCYVGGKIVFATRAYPDDETGARARLLAWTRATGYRLVMQAEAA